jgi:transcriptional regulator with PAS, ATPase and Fis domain
MAPNAFPYLELHLDLYYRLHGVDVQVPPLRARREDITELARYFLERHRFVRQLQLSTAAADALLAYGLGTSASSSAWEK